MNETASKSNLWKQLVRDKLFQLLKQTWEEMQVASTQQEAGEWQKEFKEEKIQLKIQNKITTLFNSR